MVNTPSPTGIVAPVNDHPNTLLIPDGVSVPEVQLDRDVLVQTPGSGASLHGSAATGSDLLDV